MTRVSVAPPTRPARRTRAALTLLAGAATLGATTACAGLFGRGSANQPRISVTFVNESQSQAAVYAVGTSGDPFRIGNVAPGRTETLNLPRATFAPGTPVYFMARTLSTSRFVQSGPITIVPGDRVTLTLPPAANTIAVLPGR